MQGAMPDKHISIANKLMHLDGYLMSTWYLLTVHCRVCDILLSKQSHVFFKRLKQISEKNTSAIWEVRSFYGKFLRYNFITSLSSAM